MTRTPDRGRWFLNPLGIALLYAVVSAIWIIFSDRIIALVGGDLSISHLTRIQTLKGILYISLTAGFIYLLIETAARQVTSSRQKLQEVETRYVQLFEKTGAIILIVDAVSREIVEANRAAELFYGWSRTGLTGKSLRDIELDPEPGIGPVASGPEREQRLASGRHRLASGEERDVSVALTSIVADGRRLEFLFIHDVTEQRLLERQLRQAQKLEAVGQLTGGIAHDLNNVLTVVLADADLIARGLPEDSRHIRSDLDDLRAAARRGASMIRKLLSFSRNAMLHLTPLDLGRAVQELEAAVRGILPEGIRLNIKDRGTGPVLMDRVALEQILLNLVTNSRDAMPGGGTLTLETGNAWLEPSPERSWVRAGQYAYLKVTDTGAGMDERTRARVFEPFFTTRPQPEGTGLGMAVIYGLVKQHGGFVFVESAPGAGTTVMMNFPPAPRLDQMATSEVSIESGGGGETILLVEDEDALRRAGQRILERLGYVVISAPNGQRALEILDEQGEQIDLVISDMIMPKIGGRALFEAARARRSDVKFLFTSGYAGLGSDERVPLPDVPFIQKPWTYDELGEKVRQVLDNRA